MTEVRELAARLRELTAQAAPTPWRGLGGTYLHGADTLELSERIDCGGRRAFQNAAFILETVNALPTLLAAIEALSTQVEELRGVLKPFALQPERDNQSLSDQWQVSRNPEITMGDLRRAARALASEQTGG